MSGYYVTYSGLGVLAALALIFCLPFFQRLRRRSRTPFVYYSQVADLPPPSTTTRYQRWYTLPDKLFVATLILFALALTNMRLLLPPPISPGADSFAPPQTIMTPTEGIALYFMVDISGSMAAQVPFNEQMDHKLFQR